MQSDSLLMLAAVALTFGALTAIAIPLIAAVSAGVKAFVESRKTRRLSADLTRYQELLLAMVAVIESWSRFQNSPAARAAALDLKDAARTLADALGYDVMLLRPLRDKVCDLLEGVQTRPALRADLVRDALEVVMKNRAILEDEKALARTRKGGNGKPPTTPPTIGKPGMRANGAALGLWLMLCGLAIGGVLASGLVAGCAGLVPARETQAIEPCPPRFTEETVIIDERGDLQIAVRWPSCIMSPNQIVVDRASSGRVVTFAPYTP